MVFFCAWYLILPYFGSCLSFCRGEGKFVHPSIHTSYSSTLVQSEVHSHEFPQAPPNYTPARPINSYLEPSSIIPHLPCLIISSYKFAVPSRLIPHSLQMLNDGKISIQKPIHAVCSTSFLSLIQLATPNGTRNTFLPTDIRERVDSYENKKC